MERQVAGELERWLEDRSRRPIILRGARQVGKTWLVRDLAARATRDLVELNFERDPGARRYFARSDPRHILEELSLARGRDVEPRTALLFLDEIQAAGDLLARLRWFHEELPELPVIAAGSLLDFTLAEHSFSMPVGRVRFVHLEPMDFSEYLAAHGETRLLRTLRSWRPGSDLGHAAHERATEWLHRYAMVGGFPAVVAADVEGKGPRSCREIQFDLLVSFRADFAKYAGRMDRLILDSVLSAAARSLGGKFVYARVGEGVKQHQAKRALELLSMASLCHLVPHSSANGVPLGAEISERSRKAVLVDVGLLHALAGTPAGGAYPRWESLPPSFRGQVADQLAAQQLRIVALHSGGSPALYYWHREGGRPGEVDYLLQINNGILPVELKSGSAGSMKSLHQFMFEKRLPLALRCDANPPSLMDVSVKTTLGQPVSYRLLSLPLYLLWNLAEILDPEAGTIADGARTEAGVLKAIRRF